MSLRHAFDAFGPQLAACLLLILLPLGILAQPEIDSTSSHTLASGSTTDLRIRGKNLSELTSVWTTFPSQVTILEADAGNGSIANLRFELPEEPATAFGAIRLVATNGVSELHAVMLEDLPAASDSEKNHSPASAQKTSWPIAIDGTCTQVGSDYFRLPGKQGQWISVEAVAARIGSQLDPVISILTTEGRELAFADDTPGIAPDAALRFQFPADGDYLIAIRDSTYEKGGAHQYHLRIGDFPIPATPYPLAVQRGTQANIQFPGLHSPKVEPLRLDVPTNAPARVLSSVRVPEGAASSPVSILSTDLNELAETEPNNHSGEATKVTLPAGINGRLQEKSDHDWYAFDAKKGERWLLTGQARALDSPAELFLRIHDANGKVLKEADVSDFAEAMVDLKVGSDGTYFLHVEELSWLGGPDFSYRVEAQPWSDGFDLSVADATYSIQPGKEFEIKVAIKRRSYDGEIKLGLVTPAEGLSVVSGDVEKKKDEGKLKLKVAEGLAPGTLVHLKVSGTAKVDGQDFTTTASTGPALKKRWPQVSYPLPELDGPIAVGIRK